MNYSFLYIIVALAAIAIEIKLTPNMRFNHLGLFLISPSETKWFRWGLAVVAVWTFGIWTFENLFGIDLHTALVNQTLEAEVNSWNDLNFFETQFIYLKKGRIATPGFLELILFSETAFHSDNKLVNTG